MREINTPSGRIGKRILKLLKEGDLLLKRLEVLKINYNPNSITRGQEYTKQSILNINNRISEINKALEIENQKLLQIAKDSQEKINLDTMGDKTETNETFPNVRSEKTPRTPPPPVGTTAGDAGEASSKETSLIDT